MKKELYVLLLQRRRFGVRVFELHHMIPTTRQQRENKRAAEQCRRRLAARASSFATFTNLLAHERRYSTVERWLAHMYNYLRLGIVKGRKLVGKSDAISPCSSSVHVSHSPPCLAVAFRTVNTLEVSFDDTVTPSSMSKFIIRSSWYL